MEVVFDQMDSYFVPGDRNLLLGYLMWNPSLCFGCFMATQGELLSIHKIKTYKVNGVLWCNLFKLSVAVGFPRCL